MIPPQILVEPAMYIAPILHILIDLVNKVWSLLCFFLDKFVQAVIIEEAEVKEKYELYEQVMKDIKEDIDIHTVNKNYASAEMNSDPEAINIYQSSFKILKNLEFERKTILQSMKETKYMMMKEQRKYIGDETGIGNILYSILEDYKIKRQSFHGGAMNRVPCCCLLDNLDVIFPKIRSLVRRRVWDNYKRSKLISLEELDNVLDTFVGLFETMDILFSLLSQYCPIEEEINKTDHCINKLWEYKWNKLELSHTPKLHILLDHTFHQVIIFSEIADLAEKFVEKSHQIGKRLDHITACMNSQHFCHK